jgi:hypothetical protein
MNPLAFISLTFASAAFISCTATQKLTSGTKTWVNTTTSATLSGASLLSEKIRPAGVNVVEVREQDLKDLPMGRDRALAFEKTRRQGWFFHGPVDFVEPALPVAGGEMDGSLLPPRTP